MADEETPPPYTDYKWHDAEVQIASTINEIARQANMIVGENQNQRFQLQLMQATLWGSLATVRLARREDERAKLVEGLKSSA